VLGYKDEDITYRKAVEINRLWSYMVALVS